MGFFRTLLGYGLVRQAVKSGARSAIQKEVRRLDRQQGAVPFETTLELDIPIDDDTSPEGLEETLDDEDANCLYVDEDCEGGPRFFTPDGREVDGDGFPISATERDYREYRRMKARGQIPASSAQVPLSRAEKHRHRAEKRRQQEEELRHSLQALKEMDDFLKDHSPEELDRWLLERSQP